MADDIILPTPDEIVGPAIDAVVAARPAALWPIGYGRGRWSHLAAAWRAQAALALRYVADEVAQRRRPTATGQGLLELAQSEFGLRLDTAPTRAVGDVTLSRATTASGVIPAGVRFVRRPNPRAVPLPLLAAEIESSQPVFVATGATSVAVPVRATRAGAHANTVLEDDEDPNDYVLADTLFDTFTLTKTEMAGGSDGLEDEDVRRLISSWATGQHGPNRAAILAGALLSTGARHAAVMTDVATRRTIVFPADSSWASSTRFCSSVAQTLNDEYVGFGLGVTVRRVDNIYVRALLTVRLRDDKYLSDTTSIQERIRADLRAYFDDRPDWYTWRLSAIRAIAARADRRVQTCSSATVKSRTGVTLTEPSISTTAPPSTLQHYYLADDAVEVTFLGPA